MSQTTANILCGDINRNPARKAGKYEGGKTSEARKARFLEPGLICFLDLSIPERCDSDNSSMSQNRLPEYQGHMGKLNALFLIRQGFLLHLATVNSALRVSQSFRNRWGTQWLPAWLKRIKDECGMMLALFFVLTIMNMLVFPDYFWAAESIAVFAPGLLSTLQLTVDNLRPDARAYCDPTTFAGLSVKRKKLDGGGYAWQFFNHYGFPVGHGNGRQIRQALHDQAAAAAVPVTCLPQNPDIRYMYANERELHSTTGNLMLWDYR